MSRPPGVVHHGVGLFHVASRHRGPQAGGTDECGGRVRMPVVGQVVVIARYLPNFAHVAGAVRAVVTGVFAAWA